MERRYILKCPSCLKNFTRLSLGQTYCSRQCEFLNRLKKDLNVVKIENKTLRQKVNHFQMNQRKRKKSKKTTSVPKKHDFHPFYDSQEWKKLRYLTLRDHVLRNGKKCLLCGSLAKVLHVDHIKPRSKYPKLALDYKNLQVLCKDCNLGKSNIDETDWRRREQ